MYVCICLINICMYILTHWYMDIWHICLALTVSRFMTLAPESCGSWLAERHGLLVGAIYQISYTKLCRLSALILALSEHYTRPPFSLPPLCLCVCVWQARVDCVNIKHTCCKGPGTRTCTASRHRHLYDTWGASLTPTTNGQHSRLLPPIPVYSRSSAASTVSCWCTLRAQ